MLEKTFLAFLEANLVSLTSAITACTHRWPLALHLLQQIKVDVVAYNAAISVLSRVSPVPWIQALQLFQEMQKRKMEANKKTYGALAKAFERGRGVKDAFFRLKGMLWRRMVWQEIRFDLKLRLEVLVIGIQHLASPKAAEWNGCYFDCCYRYSYRCTIDGWRIMIAEIAESS